MKKTTQVAIVGGGIFGACAAYELSKSGLGVTIIERDPIGSHASGKNPGNLNPILATPPLLQPFALASFHLHQSLITELARLGCRDYKVEKVRRLMVCFNDDDRQELEPIAKQFNNTKGFSADWLDSDQINQIDKRISPNIESALLLEGNLSLDSLAFNHAVIEGAKYQGASLFPADLQGISRIDHGYTLHTNCGDIHAETIVLASGHWVSNYREWLGIDIPIKPVKGEMLRLRLPGKNITHDLTHGLISLYRRGDDEVWLGVTREAMVSDELPTEAGKKILLEGAMRILPSISDAIELEHLASIRPMAPGGTPIICKAPGLSNIFIANGGGIKGMLTSAGVGRAIRDLVLNGATELPIGDFSLDIHH